MSHEAYAVFIDGQNFFNSISELCPGRRIDFAKLLAFLKQAVPGGRFLGAYYYCVDFTGVNGHAAKMPRERASWDSFLVCLRNSGFSPCIKPANKVSDGNGGNIIKGNQDLEIAVDIALLCAAQRVDRIILATSDQDFTYLMDKIKQPPYAVQTILLCKKVSAGRLKHAASRVIHLDDAISDLLQDQRPES